MKTCTACKCDKPLDAFPKNKSKADGRHYYCRECLRDYYARNAEKIRQRQNAYARAQPAKEAARRRRRYVEHDGLAYYKAWRARNLDKVTHYARRARERDPEKHRARSRAWFKAHPEIRAVYGSQRRARIRAANGKVSASEWVVIQATFGHRCAYCWADGKKLTMDHVVPLIRGGVHRAENIVPACHFCNASKGSKILPNITAQVLLLRLQSRVPPK